ncbi:putative uncharacterized protein DDB_G0285119 [Ceratina calcarata]|uniref:Uncharacterized protein n=1 Tax=Ceratina calcarata TaxID=156304 RepID=A0AAJ7WEJ1_9HYME|nr:putative uncharacterized protein DDB_G0285119 [Ceratina calcarata]
MHDLCPLCLKKGAKKNIKLLQINLKEAVWMCEEEKCLWPFGYEDLEFSHRVVGEIWSCYWKDYKPTSRLKENIVPIKPSVCETSTSESKTTSEELITNCTKHIISNSTNITNSACVSNNLSASIPEKLYMTACIKTEELNDEDDNVLNNTITINNPDLNDSNEEDIKIKTEVTDLWNVGTESKDDVALIKVKNERRTPKITSIKKTNINVSNVKIKNEISIHQDSSQTLLKAKKPVNVEGSELIESRKLSYSEHIKRNDMVSKSNLSVTKMEIDGLPPITLAYEMPEFTTIPETISNLKLCHKTNDTKPISSETKSTFVKRDLNSGKHYEKFSFNAIKKKIESSNGNGNTNSNNSSSIKTNVRIRETEYYLTNDTEKKDNSNNSNLNIASNDNKRATENVDTNADTTCTSNQLSNSMICLPSQENVAPVTEVANTSANIDAFLEDFLANDHSASEDINDDWLTSLLI